MKNRANPEWRRREAGFRSLMALDTSPASPDDRRLAGWSGVTMLVLLAALVAVSFWAFTDTNRTTRAPLGERSAPTDVYNPVTAGEPLPDGFRQLLPRDAIRPVYEPRFVAAASAGWPDATDVIGVAEGGEAKAYPVSFLNGREMVIDEIDRQPIVVTW